MDGRDRPASGLLAESERHQVALYLVAIALGALLGLVLPALRPVAEGAITPALGLLIFVTFLGVPFRRMREALRDRSFLLLLIALNFVLIPLLVFVLSRAVAGDEALLLGVLLVLLTPCVDYVVVFTRIAGGDAERLLAATPVLMLAQILLLPLFLWLFAGADAVSAMDPMPIVRAFVVLIVVPLGCAVLVQAIARRAPAVRRAGAVASRAMVPLMMLVLFTVVASQIRTVVTEGPALLPVLPLFLGFALVAAVLGLLLGRIGSPGVPARRALLFSGVTRNSLVVLPLALATESPLTPVVVVAQTLVELLVMVALTVLVPRLIPEDGSAPAARA